MIVRGLRAAKCVAASSIISPAPTSSSRWSLIDGKMRSASFTAAAAIEIDALPMSVWLRTSFATANVRWNSRFSTRPSDPADSATRTACFICPRICGSPSTIESRPEATRNACETARSFGSVYRCDGERVARQSVEALEPVRDLVRRFAAEVDLGPVAGRQDRRFLRLARSGQVAQRVAQHVGAERDALPHVERRGRVVEAEGEQ